MYLNPMLNEKLVPQLKRLRPGARVVSHDWDIRGLVPDVVIENFESVEPDFLNLHRILLWRAPVREAGEGGD